MAEVKQWRTQANLNVGAAPDWLSPAVAKYKDWNNFKREAQAAMARWYTQRDVGVETSDADAPFPALTATGGTPVEVVGILDGTPELLVRIQSTVGRVPTLRWRAPATVGGTARDVVTRLVETHRGALLPDALQVDNEAFTRLLYDGSRFLLLSRPRADRSLDWGTPIGFSTTTMTPDRLEQLSIVLEGENITMTVPSDANQWWPIGAGMHVVVADNASFTVQTSGGLFFPGFATLSGPGGPGFGAGANLVTLWRSSAGVIEFAPSVVMPLPGGP